LITTAPPSSEASVSNSQQRPTSRTHIAFAPVSGEIRPIALVSDNEPCFKAVRFAAFIQKRPELIHIRTRRKSPQQNGVRGRAFGSLKYEHYARRRDGLLFS